jgi:hypothetical protein
MLGLVHYPPWPLLEREAKNVEFTNGSRKLKRNPSNNVVDCSCIDQSISTCALKIHCCNLCKCWIAITLTKITLGLQQFVISSQFCMFNFTSSREELNLWTFIGCRTSNLGVLQLHIC